MIPQDDADRTWCLNDHNGVAIVVDVVSIVLQFVSSIAGCLFTLTIAETGKNAVEAVMAILEEVVSNYTSRLIRRSDFGPGYGNTVDAR